MDARPRLPEYESPFVGRSAELSRLSEAVAAGRQLITLVGPGGVGKTRLAVQYARTLPHIAADPPAGPVWFCDLTGTQTAPDVCGAVSRALRMPFDAGPPTADAASRIGHWLRGCGPAVLILTGFEQAVRHASFTVGVWHATAPEVVFLIASREPLRLPHEVRVDVLPFPPPLIDAESAVSAGENEAARVFIAAAPAGTVEPSRPADARSIAEIVRRTHGVPLALEIAAGTLRGVSIVELVAALGVPSAPTPPGPMAGPVLRETDADRAVRRVVDFACERLPNSVRAFLTRTSLFAGGFTMDAAQAVVRVDDDAEPDSARAAIEALIDRGLLRRDTSGGRDTDARFAYWPPVRDAGARMLAADGSDAATLRFASYFVERGEAWADQAFGPDGPAMLERLAAEHDNLRAVLRTALAVEKPSEASLTNALRVARALSPLLATRGTLVSQLAALDEVLHAASLVAAMRETALFASVLVLRSEALRFRGRADDAALDADRALGIANALGERTLAARATEMLGIVEHNRGNVDRAATLVAEALDAYRAQGERALAAATLSRLGLLRVEKGDLDEGARMLESALAEQREVGDRRGEGITLSRLGQLHLERNDLSRARLLLDQALEIHRALGARRFEANALGYLAIIQHLQGQLPGARRGYRQAAGMMREFGDRRFEGYYRAYLGILDLEERKIDAAGKGLREALGILRTVRDARYEGIVLGATAVHQAARGNADDADALLEQCRESLEAASDPLVRPVAEAYRAACEAAQADRARKAGDDPTADALLAAARTRVSTTSGTMSDDVRLALRVFERFAESAAPPWQIDPHGMWFRAPGQDRVSLATRPAHARLLAALVRARAEDPGGPVGLDDLARATFAGDHATARARRNRARVMIRALRRAGLGALLRERDHGFLLDHRATVRIATPAAA